MLPIVASRFANMLESIARAPVKGFAIEKMTYITSPLKAEYVLSMARLAMLGEYT